MKYIAIECRDAYTGHGKMREFEVNADSVNEAMKTAEAEAIYAGASIKLIDGDTFAAVGYYSDGNWDNV